MAAINSGNTDEVGSFSGMRLETVSRTTTNAEALDLMQKLGLEAILAKDGDDKPIEVVERQHIINEMEMTLVKRANE